MIQCVGMFAIAEAMKNVGLILGTCLTIFLSIVCLYEQHTLLKYADEIQQYYKLEKRCDYGETFERSLLANDKWRKHSKLMKRIANIFLIVTQLGFCSVYILFIGNNLSKFLNYFDMNFDVRVTILFAIIPIIIPAMITNLKFLGE